MPEQFEHLTFRPDVINTRHLLLLYTFGASNVINFQMGLLTNTKHTYAHGGMQTWGLNYWETCAPVVNWASVCLILAIAKIHDLS